jgi:hypothetical protein
MPMNCWLLQGQLIIKEVAYATNQVLCQASFVWLIHYECQGVSLKVSGVRCRVSGVEVSGVRCRVSGTINIEAETCWSEAEIPSEAKRQRGTLKPQSLSNHRTFFLTMRGGMLTSAFLHFATHSARLDSLGEMDGL